MMDYVLERAQVIRGLSKVRNPLLKRDLPKRAQQRKKGCLSGAVLAYQEGERGQSGGLLFPEATIVMESDFIRRLSLAAVDLRANRTASA